MLTPCKFMLTFGPKPPPPDRIRVRHGSGRRGQGAAGARFAGTEAERPLSQHAG